jgi:hypothetical protein
LDPKRGQDDWRQIIRVLIVQLMLCTESKANRERDTKSFSTAPVVFLLSDEGEGSTSGEASLGSAPSDPLPNHSLSPLHSVVTLQILGALEYKDHQVLDVGHR